MERLKVTEKVECHEGNADSVVFEKGKTLVVGEDVSQSMALRVVLAGAGEFVSDSTAKATKKAATVAGGEE